MPPLPHSLGLSGRSQPSANHPRRPHSGGGRCSCLHHVIHYVCQFVDFTGGSLDGNVRDLLSVEMLQGERGMECAIRGPAPTGPTAPGGACELHGLVVLKSGQRLRNDRIAAAGKFDDCAEIVLQFGLPRIAGVGPRID